MVAGGKIRAVQRLGDSPIPRELLYLVEETPFRSLGDLLDGMVERAGVRKSSKAVVIHWMLDILEINEPRTLALTAALYFEHLVEQHLRHESLDRKRRPLAVELDRMASGGYLDEDLCSDMQAIVKLRNAFAHNLFYDMSDWDPLASPFLAKRPPRMPKPPHLRRTKSMVLVKILLVSILFRLHGAFPWLTFENVPKGYRKRSNRALTNRLPTVSAAWVAVVRTDE